ncbi:MAG: CIA30 family protein [Chitinispirillaceae bacterium]|nr:CIA30 family protein [Chitinispirillaceae bacterium]
MKNKLTFLGVMAFILVSFSNISATQSSQQDSIHTIFFSENYYKNGFGFGAGGKTSLKVKETEEGKIIEIKLDDKIYGSEAAISIGNDTSIDCSPFLKNGAISFRLKGNKGNEKFYISLKDAGNPKGENMTMSRCPSWHWFTTTNSWQRVIIPLAAFPETGNKWYTKEMTSEASKIDIKHINTISFSSEKYLNYGYVDQDSTITIFIDDLMVLSQVKELPISKEERWALLFDTVTPPNMIVKKDEKLLTFFNYFSNDIAKYTSIYTYGGRTDFKINYSNNDSLLSVLCCYLDDKEWSGVTLYRGNPAHSLNLLPYRDSGSIEFFVKGEKGGETFYIGILDDESDGRDRRVQVRVPSKNYIKVTKEWQLVSIPFSDFGDMGKWWDSEAFYEVAGIFDWSKVSDIRFSTDKYVHNKITDDSKKPVKLYFADIKLLKNYRKFNNILYWKEFKSDASDITVEDFEDSNLISQWKIVKDLYSELKVSSGKNENNNSKALRIDHKIFEYARLMYEFTDKEKSKRDWSKHSTIKFDYYSTALKQLAIMVIIDSSGEAWSSFFETRKGWQEIVLPFKDFRKYEDAHLSNADLNGRLDLEKVISYGFIPISKDKKHTIIIDNLVLTNRSVLSEEEKRRCVLYNQVGYERKGKKRFFVTDTSSYDFAITDTNGNLVYSSKLDNRGEWKSAKAFIKSGDFTEVNNSGKYILHIGGSGEKREINIGENIYLRPLNAAIKAFYFQRSGIDIVKPFAENWPRKGGHPDTACSLHISTGKSGIINVRGGWYDAGDYGKYITSAGVSVWLLLSLYEIFPFLISDSLNIPESGNKISDLLDEVRFELEWMKRMQDSDGGVFFKVGPLDWDGFISPDSSKAQRYVIGKSTASTLNFAHSMAKAARIYKKVDKKFASDCLKRAVAAWKWALKNPNIREPSECGGTGAYADEHYADEFFLAATELFLTSGKSEFKKYIEKNINENLIEGKFSWLRVNNLAIMALLTSPKSKDITGKDLLVKNFNWWCDSIMSVIERHPCHLPSDGFEWGSNNDFLSYAISLCYAHLLTKKEKYLDGVIAITDYIFGSNACGYSFVTGFGVISPKAPHHRIMASDKIEEPIPGFLVGGPNANMDDAMDLTGGVYYKYKEPALTYMDEVSAYACNEVAINWNANLVFVMGYLSGCRAK